MFSFKKTSTELEKAYAQIRKREQQIADLSVELNQKTEENARLQLFDKMIDEKLEKLCGARITSFFDSTFTTVSSGFCSISTSNELRDALDSLKKTNEGQNLKIKQLEEDAERTKSIFVLTSKIEELLKKLNLKKGSK